MAYKTEIQIGVKGTAALDKLRKNISDLSEKVDLVNKSFRGGIQSVDRYEKALSKAADTLREVRVNTDDERQAIENYVSVLGKANGARARQNKLIDAEISKQKELARIARQATGFTASQYGPQPAAGFDPAAGASRVRTALAEQQSIKEINQRRVQERALLNEQIKNDLKFAEARLKSNDRVFKDRIAKNKKALDIFDKELAKRDKAKQTANDARGKMAENLMLGAGFPLLFGGGPGQVAGGLAGSFIGTGFGGQIIGSALGQILEDAVIRIREIGSALRALDMDALRESAIFVNAELDTTVRRLIEAGRAQEAQGVIAAAVANQTGLSADAVERTTNNTNMLANAWQSVTAAYSGYLALGADPIVEDLNEGFDLLSKMNIKTEDIVGSTRDYFLAMVGINPELLKGLNYLKGEKEQVKVLSEEEEKRIALLTQSNDRRAVQIKNTKALSDIEAKRIAETSVADKQHNANVDYQRQQEQIKQQFAEQTRLTRLATAGLEGEQVQRALDLLDIEKQQALTDAQRVYDLKMQNLEIEKQREKEKELKELAKERSEKYKEMVEDVRLQTSLLNDQATSLNYQAEIANNVASLSNARRQTESDLLDLQIARLGRQQEEKKHFLDKIKLNNIIIDKRKEQARIEYESQLTSIKLSVSKAEQERIQIKLKEQQIKLQLEQVRLEAEAIQDADRRNAALGRINKQQQSTLQVVEDMNRAADHSLETTRKIAAFQQQSAKYAYQGKIEALETARQQERMAIFLNSQKSSMNSLATQSGEYASNMERAANAAKNQKTAFERGELGATKTITLTTDGPIDKDIQQRIQNKPGGWKSPEAMIAAMNAAQRNRDSGGRINTRYYAQGGFVNRPHIGMVGEGGPEYIIPESKAAAFATNYMMGARGAAAIPRYAEGGYVGPINVQTGPVMQQGGTNYVTMAQFEKGLMDLASSFSASNRSYGARQYMGVQR